MKQTQHTTIILEATEGMYITNLDNTIVSKRIYLGKHDSPSNYHEITDEEGKKILEERRIAEFIQK